MAGKLGIDVGQIGLTMLEQGSPRLVDQDGVKRVEGIGRLVVHYAWARRTEEDAAIYTPRRMTEPQQQLVPGMSTHLHRTVRLTNKAGATAMVQFAWTE